MKFKSDIQAESKVGIGTATVNYPLDVRAGSANSDVAQFTGANDSRGLKISTFQVNGADDSVDYDCHTNFLLAPNVGVQTWSMSGNEKMRLNQSGALGIGTTSASDPLVVRNGTSDTSVKILSFNNATGTEAILKFSTFASETNNVKAAIIAKNAAGSFGRSDMHFALDDAANSGNVQLSDTKMTILNGGNVGIGTTGPGSKLEVAGEIDATTGDGYKINGKPWASLESNTVFRLGDWDGEGFSTIIYDENSRGVVKVKDYGTMINTSGLSSSYGSRASLAVGTIGNESAGAGVITLANNDTTASAGDPTGEINFAIKSDTGTGSLGYTSAIISGSIFANAGTGNSGGGILDFKTSPASAGSAPQTRIRINQLGDVGIGTTDPGAKLDVSSSSGGVLRLTSSDTSVATGESIGRVEFKSNDASTGGNNVMGFVDCLATNAGTTYALTFGTGSAAAAAEKMRINPNGNVGIGTTDPQEKLHVYEDVEGNTLIEVENTRGNSTAGVKLTSGSNNYIAYTNDDGDFEILNSQTGKVNFVIAANGQGAFGNAIDTSTGADFRVGGGGGVSASKYINQRVVWATGFSHATNNSSAYYYFPVAGYLLTTSNQYYNGWIAPYAGRVKRITIRNVSGTSTAPTATTVNFRVSVNGSVIYTGANVTIVGTTYNKYAFETIISSNADFVAFDRIQVAFRTNGLWRNAAASISLEYTE